MNLAARISIAIEIEEIDNGCAVHVDELAEAVSFVLRAEYGQHNYESFINTLNKHLYPHGK